MLVRYGEIALKGPYTRSRMEQLLVDAIRSRLDRKGIKYESIIRERARIIVITEENEDAARELTKVFGVVSTSPAIEVPNDMDTLARYALEVAIKEKERGIESFAIRARRDKRYSITSKDIEKIVGQAVKDGTGLRVDLRNPDLVIGIEVWMDRAFIYTKTFKGPGGLPYGSEGNVIVLFSGGMDSTLAMWLSFKRGCKAKPLFLDTGRFWSNRARERVLRVAKELREWIPEPLELFVGKGYEKVMERILEEVEPRLRCLVCKSCMLRIAMRLAKEIGAKAIVTGESLGQVASQTLDNIASIDSTVYGLPIFRPLVFLDKEEIASKLRELGLYDIVAIDVGKCKLVPQYPETRSKVEEIHKYRDIIEESADVVEIESIVLD